MTIIDTKTLLEWMNEARNFVLIDTLPPTAFAKEHLPGAINIMSDDILARAGDVLNDKQRAIVVYCASEKCKRAGLSAARLDTLGYANVYKFAGGKRAWREAGHPLEGGA